MAELPADGILGGVAGSCCIRPNGGRIEGHPGVAILGTRTLQFDTQSPRLGCRIPSLELSHRADRLAAPSVGRAHHRGSSGGFLPSGTERTRRGAGRTFRVPGSLTSPPVRTHLPTAGFRRERLGFLAGAALQLYTQSPNDPRTLRRPRRAACLRPPPLGGSTVVGVSPAKVVVADSAASWARVQVLGRARAQTRTQFDVLARAAGRSTEIAHVLGGTITLDNHCCQA